MKRSTRQSSRRSGRAKRLRLTLLLATVAAFLLVPAAQAFAESEVEVTLAGTGSGEVSSVGGAGPAFGNELAGQPQPIDCHGTPPGEGTCADETSFAESLSTEGIFLREKPAAGSEFAGFVVESGDVFGGCPTENRPLSAEENELFEAGTFAEGERPCFMGGGSGTPDVVTAYFNKTGPSGPTNRRTLTVTKSANGPGGTGTVSSKPKGIKCGATCSSAVGSFYEKSPVELTAKPATGSTFVKWHNPGGACNESTSTTCTMPIEGDEAVEAVFSGTSKTITPTEALTVSKGESTGFGTVKASGLACEAECTSTVALYQGPITSPKAKPGKVVALTEVAAPGSKFAGWSGACTGTGTCEVAMEEAKSVTATFDLLPPETLTITKSANGPGGTGTVSSKPKGIKCGATCESAQATFWEGAAVELTAKPATGSTFVKWHNPGGACNESTSLTCTATLSKSESVEAVFSGTSKTITPTEALTVSKSGSGLGTVKASGLACEVLCSQTAVLFQGPITSPKAKPGKVVALTEVAAPGSEFAEWTGACTGSGTCEVEMSEAKSVGAKFNELP